LKWKYMLKVFYVPIKEVVLVYDYN